MGSRPSYDQYSKLYCSSPRSTGLLAEDTKLVDEAGCLVLDYMSTSIIHGTVASNDDEEAS